MTPRPWLLLIIVLLLCAPPALVNVGAPSPTRIMESLSFLTAQETWLRQQSGDNDAWKMPTWNGRPRVEKPPLLVWLNMLAWADLDADATPIDILVLRSRLLAAALALLAVAAIFWAGATLGGVRLGTLAALATGSGVFFIRQARYASYDTHIMGWATLAVAAGLWAMRAGGIRFVLGWLVNLLALTAANYTKGPLGFALVAPPLAAAAFVFTEQRRRNAVSLVVTTLAAAALLAPWFVVVSNTIPDARELFEREYIYVFEMFKNPLYYLAIIGLVFPWTLWLIAGLALPFADRERRKDRGLLFAWSWLVVMLVVLTLSPVKNKRYIVPALPPAGLLVAYVWTYLQEKVAQRSAPKWSAWCGRLHWGVLIAASLLAPVFILIQDRLVERGLLDGIQVAGVSRAGAIAVGGLLLVIGIMGWRAHTSRVIHRSAILTALWMLLAATFGYMGYAVADHQMWPQRGIAENLAVLTGRTNTYFISRFTFPSHQAKPGDEFLIYYRGIIPKTNLDEIGLRLEKGESFYLLSRLEPKDEQTLMNMGLQYMFEVDDSRPPNWRLFHFQSHR